MWVVVPWFFFVRWVMSKRKVTHRVDGSEVVKITEERAPRVVLWSDLIAACRWQPEDEYSAPWSDCDGWEHTATALGDLPDHVDRDEVENAVGCCWDEGNRRRVLITIDNIKSDPWGNYAAARAEGASRQVAAEEAAKIYRKAVKQLADWYEFGWSNEYCVCEFGDYSASLGGVMDASDEYRAEVEAELAAEIAGQMKKDGYKIKGRPVDKSKRLSARQLAKCVSAKNGIYTAWMPRAMTAEAWRAEFARKLASQNVEARDSGMSSRRIRRWRGENYGRRLISAGDVKGGVA